MSVYSQQISDANYTSNIRKYLENPFDQVGEGDINFNVEKFIEHLNHRFSGNE
ncbi:MAG: hypothetical protein JKY02_05515 [Flavobacteriaceae bacterium]|nr:hypothetical protein [Flavobacteriaceae bacterium]